MHTRDLPCQHVDRSRLLDLLFGLAGRAAWDWDRSMGRQLVLLVLNVLWTGIRSGS